MAIENMGIPFPTEASYILGQNYITHAQVSYVLILSILVAGQTIGSLLSYFLGRRIALSMHIRPELDDVQEKVAGWFGKYGYITVFATRLLGYVRPWSSYVAGIAEVPFWPFLYYSVSGTIVFTAVSLLLTKQIVYLWHHYFLIRVILNTSFAVGFIIVAYLLLKKRFTKKQK